MQRLFNALSLCLILTGSSLAQNASTYFPASPGYVWYYSNTPLDSQNVPISSLRTYQVDSFATVTNYQGLTASKVMSKSGLLTIGQPTPFTDTSYYNFQTTNAWTYLNVLQLLDSIEILDSTFYAFIRSLDGWYSTYRFSQTVNTNYTILSRDTTITIDTLVLPIRVQTIGRRLNDQTISTINGNFLAKKFNISFVLSYGVTIPPFPTVYIPIITRPDTVYIGSNVWVLRDVVPSVNVDLTGLGIPIQFFIPGSVKEVTNPSSGITGFSAEIPSGFELQQNFPNPFNPSTKISFSLAEKGMTVLELFNSLGQSSAVLINEELQPGSYEYTLDASHLPAGAYFYSLTSGSGRIVKKMVLVK